MKPLLLAAGIAVVLVGLLFAGQRLGYIPWPRTDNTASHALAAPQPATADTTKPIAANTEPVETAGNATWIAACYDGRTLQYSQTLGGNGFLYLDIGDGDYQRIALVQSSYDGKTICSVDDVRTPGVTHLLKVCADAENNTITVSYKDPTGK